MANLRARALVALLVATPLAAQWDIRYPDMPARTYEEALARYKTCLARKAFRYHHEAREALAAARTPEALTLLVGDYRTVKEDAEQIRYAIADDFARFFEKPEFLPPLLALRDANKGPGDVWLWYHTLRMQTDHGDEAAVMEVAHADKNALLRAAAIAALGDSRNGALKDAIVPNCAAFPKKESERMALLGAMSGALLANKSRVNAEDYRAALTAYIGLLADDVKLSHVGKVQMARHLQIILKAPAPFVDPQSWLDILARGELKTATKQTTTATPRFFGLETDGERMVYVVDMSDSMLLPIEPSAKPKGPITGPKEKKKKGAVLDESDLPWHQIGTRWDLARENLRISLSRLTPDKEFCVVWFGKQAGTLDACKGLMKATRGNIDKVMAELDGIKANMTPEQGKPLPPTGRLRGDTNLHGGLRLAFALHSKGFASSAAYVDPLALAEGCDTILLLSDGDPSIDDFYEEDKNYHEARIVQSLERGEAAPDVPTVWVPGPYVAGGLAHCPYIVADVRRMNTFRRVRMHCVGLGEANMTLTKALAELGQGESLQVGKAR
ncbi:MAG: hypothetical protein FJ301_12035 [Planctomycetes bacterium]|nr:hypothetical protein [Planctomycetota bacterium]